MEGDLLGLDLTVLDINLVSAQHNWDVLTHTAQVPMPCGHILVGETRRDVEHDDGALAVDVVAVAKATKLLLTCRVPAIEPDLASVRREVQGADLDADRGLILLLELARQVALNKRSLSGASIADQDELESWNSGRSDLP